MHAWDQFVKKIEEELGQNTVDQWIKSLKIDRFDARNLHLLASDPLQVAWFEEHIRPRLKMGLFNNNDRPIQVHISAPNKIELQKVSKPDSIFTINADRLDPELTFENFLPTTHNIVAYKLLTEIDPPQFNPIYLFGPKHSGKTHLLTAAAHYLQSKGKKIFYVRAETFTSHVVQAIRLGQMKQFRGIYREIDALIIDGIDIFSKKDATQEEFFHTFNVLQTMGKPILLSASCPPSKLVDIEPRLISRFEWGISIGIEASDPLEILQKKAALWKLSYSPELIAFLGEKFPKNPLLALQALSLRTKGMSSIDPKKATTFLEDLRTHEETKPLSSEEIISAIATHYGIREEDILGKSQTREFAYPRQVAMYLCREKLKLPFQKIGEIFSRDHSTVMSSTRQIQKLCDEKKKDLINDLHTIESTF